MNPIRPIASFFMGRKQHDSPKRKSVQVLNNSQSSPPPPPLKPWLVLIIDSDNVPIYEQFRQVWRSRIFASETIRQLGFQFVFLRFKPKLDNPINSYEYDFKNNILYCQGTESPFGILEKTIRAIRFFIDHDPTWEGVFRTNLSTAFNWKDLRATIQRWTETPNWSSWGGGFANTYDFVSGAAIAMRRNACIKLVQHGERYPAWFEENKETPDDLLIGRFLFPQFGRPLFFSKQEFIEDEDIAKEIVSPEIIMFRIKNPNRDRYDIQNMNTVYNRFDR